MTGKVGKGQERSVTDMTGMTGRNVILNVFKCHPERSEGSLAKESCKDSSLTLRMTRETLRMTRGMVRMTRGMVRMT